MKISVITVTMEGGDVLDRALRSVHNQTYSDIEHIVVAPDAAAIADVTARYPEVRVIERQPRGVYDALNCGIHNSTGEVFGFVHGNDALSSSHVIKRVAQTFEEDPELDFVYGDMRYVHPGTYKYVRIYHASRFEPRQILGGMCPPHPTLYLRREAAERIGDYSLDYPTAGDYEMWIRLFKDKSLKSKYLRMVMVNMTTGGLSTRLRARLFDNNFQKLKALRRNGLPANPLRLLQKYYMVLRDHLFDPRHER